MKILAHFVNDLSLTDLFYGETYKNLGSSCGEHHKGLQPTYGMTTQDMGVQFMVIKFTWSNFK
jgi:hypothetical protein